MWTKIREKKGFTLIELIISIGLLALLGLIIVGNTTGLFAKQQDEQYEQFKETLENAACTYLDLSVGKSQLNTCKTSGSVSIPLSTLLGQGLLEEKNLKNPQNNAMIPSTKTIRVTCSGGVKTCSYE